MIGERLRKLRDDLHWTQDDLAQRLDVSVQQINRWENNKHKTDSQTVGAIAEKLGCSTDYLLGLTDDPAPHSMTSNTLNARERLALNYWRHGELTEAIRVIVNDE